jgi:hypothetical protein
VGALSKLNLIMLENVRTGGVNIGFNAFVTTSYNEIMFEV